MTRPIDFVTELPKGEFVNSCWCNSVSKMVIKSATIRTRRKAVRTLEEFYFSKEPRLQSCLQACPDELDKQEFSRALMYKLNVLASARVVCNIMGVQVRGRTHRELYF
jgi:hypothetical protein